MLLLTVLLLLLGGNSCFYKLLGCIYSTNREGKAYILYIQTMQRPSLWTINQAASCWLKFFSKD